MLHAVLSLAYADNEISDNGRQGDQIFFLGLELVNSEMIF